MREKQMMLPDFLIAGAAKAGSSTLYHYLSKHPDVYMTREKEPAFFTANWDKGLSWYENQFLSREDYSCYGEATVEYMVAPEAAIRIKETLPDIKLLFTLRNPVPRAWSHYWHRVKMGEERREPEAVFRVPDPEDYPFRYGRYAEHLKRFFDLFPEDQIYIVLIEEARCDFDAALSAVAKFLSLDSDKLPLYQGARNEAAMSRLSTLSRGAAWIRKNNSLKESIPELIYEPLRAGFKFINNLNTKSWQYPEMPNVYYQETAKLLAPDTQTLETLLGRDLTIWSASSIEINTCHSKTTSNL